MKKMVSDEQLVYYVNWHDTDKSFSNMETNYSIETKCKHFVITILFEVVIVHYHISWWRAGRCLIRLYERYMNQTTFTTSVSRTDCLYEVKRLPFFFFTLKCGKKI